jgi:hypothetical protein
VRSLRLPQVANLQQSNELSEQAVKKAKEALAASQSAYESLCERVQKAEVRRNAIEDELLDGRVQLQALQKEVGDIEAECRRDEDVLRDLELKDAAAAGGSVQVPFRVLCCLFSQCIKHVSPPQAEAQFLLSSRRIRPLNQLGSNA